MAMMSSATEKVFRSRDIIFMEDKTLADWESEKKIKNSEEIWPKPSESRLTLKEPTIYGEGAKPVDEAEEVETGTDQDPCKDVVRKQE